jgi:phosphatidylglycerophosphatase C
MPHGIAIFDFDRTLTRQGSLVLFLNALIGKRNFIILGVRASMEAIARSPGGGWETIRASLLRRMLAGKNLAEVRTAAEAIFPRLEWKTEVMDAYYRHREAGHSLLIATGSPSCYIRILLEMKKMTVDGLVASEMTVDGETLTGELSGAYCVGREKARRVKAWLAGRNGETWGYGNLPSDAAMLALTDHPTAVPK